LIAIFALSGCVRHLIGPARTEDAYADKARATAEAAQSSVETVLLLVETAGDGDLFDNFARISISEQEDALDGVQSGFRSIQPPDRRSDELRAGLDEVLSAALEHVSTARRAVRRGDEQALRDVAEPLGDDARALESFVESEPFVESQP